MRPRPAALLAAMAAVPVAACSSGPGYSAPAAVGATPPAATGSSATTPATVAATAPLAALRPATSPSTSARAPRTSPAAATTPSASAEPSRRSSPPATPGPLRTTAPAGTTVGVDEVTGDRFSPASVTLHVGDSVLVTDRDAVAPHTFTISALHVDSGGMSQGQTFRYRFASPGTYTFVCTYHQSLGMTGTLTVVR